MSLPSPNTTWKELFYLVGMFRTLSPGDSTSVALRKLLQGVRRVKSGYMKICNKGSRHSEYQIKGLSILCMGRCKPLGSLNLYASHLSGANHISLFTMLLAFLQLLSNHHDGVAASAGLQFGEPSFTFGGQKLLMAGTFLVY